MMSYELIVNCCCFSSDDEPASAETDKGFGSPWDDERQAYLDDLFEQMRAAMGGNTPEDDWAWMNDSDIEFEAFHSGPRQRSPSKHSRFWGSPTPSASSLPRKEEAQPAESIPTRPPTAGPREKLVHQAEGLESITAFKILRRRILSDFPHPSGSPAAADETFASLPSRQQYNRLSLVCISSDD